MAITVEYNKNVVGLIADLYIYYYSVLFCGHKRQTEILECNVLHTQCFLLQGNL